MHLTGLPHPTVTRMVVFWLAAIAWFPIFRAAARGVGRRQAAYVQNVIIVGSVRLPSCSRARSVPPRVPPAGRRLRRPRQLVVSGAEAPLIGSTDDLPELVREHSCIGRHRLLGRVDEQTLDVIRVLQGSNVQIDIVPRLFEALGTNAQLAHDRRHTARRAPELAAFAFLPIPQAVARSRRGGGRADPALAGVCDHRRLHQARHPGTHFLPAGADGRRRAGVPRLQVPDDGDDAEKRKSDVAHLNMHVKDDPRMFKVPNDPRVTAWARSFAARAWMSSPSSST